MVNYCEEYNASEIIYLNRPETISKLTHAQKEKYDRHNSPGRQDGWVEPHEVNTIVSLIDMLDALNRLPWRDYNILVDYYWNNGIDRDGKDSPAALLVLMNKYRFTTTEKLTSYMLSVRRKVARWMSGRYPESGKPPLQRSETLSELIEKIF